MTPYQDEQFEIIRRIAERAIDSYQHLLDELYRLRVDIETNQSCPHVRYIKCMPTNEQCNAALQTSLFQEGDCVLVWVNEGDILRVGKNLGVKDDLSK